MQSLLLALSHTLLSGEDAVFSSERLKALDEECAGALSDCLATGTFEGKKV